MRRRWDGLPSALPVRRGGKLLAAGAHAAVARATAGRRRDDLWVFGARQGEAFADNAKYLFLHVAAARPDVRAVWVTRSGSVVERLRAAGYEAYRANSTAGLRRQLRAGVVFLTHNFDDVNRAAVGGATTVMLWHGTPLKTIGWDAELADVPATVRAVERYFLGRYDLLTVTGRGTVDAFASGLGVDPDDALVTGYPRTDALVGSVPAVGVAPAVERARRLADGSRLCLYLPTFRDDPADRAASRLSPGGLARLDRLCADRAAHVVLKLHPQERLAVDLARYPRLHALPSGVDVYPLLSAVDVLVTDYSSAYFDFLLCDRPVVFYPYDLETYRDQRSFYYDYETVTPGPRARTFGELLASLDRTLAGDDGFAADRRAVRERFFEYPAGGAAARVCDAVERARSVDS